MLNVRCWRSKQTWLSEDGVTPSRDAGGAKAQVIGNSDECCQGKAGGSLSPGSILPLRGTGGRSQRAAGRKTASPPLPNPEILPLEFLLGDDPVHGSLSGWIAELVRELHSRSPTPEMMRLEPGNQAAKSQMPCQPRDQSQGQNRWRGRDGPSLGIKKRGRWASIAKPADT